MALFNGYPSGSLRTRTFNLGVFGLRTEYPKMYYFGILRDTQSMIVSLFDSVFHEDPSQNCTERVLQTHPTILANPIFILLINGAHL